jgi:PAS domain S-box-containing protein
VCNTNGTIEQAGLLAVAEQTADGIVITDACGVIEYVNPAFTATTGYAKEEALGRKAGFLKSGRHSVAFYQELWSTIQSGGVWHGEVTNRRKDGIFYDEEMRIAPVRDSKNAITGYIAFKHDVSGQRAREVEQAFLAAIVEGSEDAIIATTQAGVILTWNHGAEALLGFTAQQAIGQEVTIFTPPDRLSRMARCIDHISQGPLLNYEGVCQRADGRRVHVTVMGFPIKDSAGKVVAATAVLRDSTERIESERKHRENEEWFRAIFEDAPFGMCVSGLDGKFIQVNEALCRMLGYSSEELLGMSWTELTHPDDLKSSLKKMGRLIDEPGGYVEDELRNIHHDGRVVWLRARATVARTSDGSPSHFVVHLEDITERRQAKQLREFQHSLIHTIHDVSLDGILVVNEEQKIVMRNKRLLDVWHFSPTKTLDHPLDITSSTPDEALLTVVLEAVKYPEAFLKRVLELYADQDASEQCEIELKDGRTLERYTTSLRNEDGKYLARAWFFRDITERKQAEADLVQAREAAEAANRKLSAQHSILDRERKILRSFIDNVPDLMYVKDTESRFVLANSALARMFGVEKPEDLLGKIDFDFFPREFAMSFYEDEQRIIRTGQPMFDCEETVGELATNEIRHILTTKMPVFDSEGQVTGVAGIGRNITERKKSEDALRDSNRQLQEATARANELALEAAAANRAKSRFLANMSHEIRTPMNGVIGMNQLLLETGLTAEQRRYVEVAQSSGRTLLALIDDILDLSKIEAGKISLEKRSFNLSHAVEDVVQLLRVQASAKGLHIDARISPRIPECLRGDAHRLRQVLTNLAANAIKFTGQGGVTLEAELDNLREGAATVRFTIADTGIGIRPDQIQALFSAFVQADASTTRKYGGTGLGLAISKQLVEMMGGGIGVTSREGEGSTFWFTAVFDRTPCGEPYSVDEQAESRSTAPDALRHAGHRERVLVAEDNFTNREVILAQLKKLGYNGEAVTNGAEAVAAVERGGFELVLMDCAMPVMDGYEATHRIRQSTQPNIPIIALTASAMPPDRERCLSEGMDDYLAKPVELPQLAGVLAKWITVSSADDQRGDPAQTRQELPANPTNIVFDSDSLLRRLMGDRELARGVLKRFIQDAPSQLEGLHVRLYELDAPGTQLRAHTLKGSAATVGAGALHAVALAMETAASGGRLDDCRDLLLGAGDEFDRFKRTVERDGWNSSANDNTGIKPG